MGAKTEAFIILFSVVISIPETMC